MGQLATCILYIWLFGFDDVWLHFHDSVLLLSYYKVKDRPLHLEVFLSVYNKFHKYSLN